MNIKFNDVDRPQTTEWEDIKVGIAAQSQTDPNNMLLKTGHSTGIRLTEHLGNPVGSTQHPGGESRWYVCETAITVSPVVELRT